MVAADVPQAGGSAPIVKIEVIGLSIRTHHGVTDAEQEIGQRLRVDIALDLRSCDALVTDRLEDTANYSEVAEIATRVATERSYRTLERLCEVIGERLSDRFGCERVRVRAAKPQPPMALSVAEVAVEVTRDRAARREEEIGEAGN